jgi:type IV secretion system protein VirB9
VTRWWTILLLVLTGLQSGMAAAQGDPRVRIVPYVGDQVVPLPVAAGYQLMVSFEAGEQIDTIAIGDAAGWKVDANKRGDFMFIKIAAGAQQTNVSVITNKRVYQFLLVPQPVDVDAALFALRFTYSDQTKMGASRAETRYRFTLSGSSVLRPASITEDGERTFLRWPDNVPLPAMYRIDDNGGQVLANSVVEGGAVVIDGIPRALVFRLGNQSARAMRKPVGAGK